MWSGYEPLRVPFWPDNMSNQSPRFVKCVECSLYGELVPRLNPHRDYDDENFV